MSININYHKQFSKEFNDFVIVLSKFSELKSIKGLPIDANTLSNTKEIEKILKEHKFYESFVRSHSTNSLHNIKILLISNPKKENCIEIGADLYTKYNTNSSPNINIFYSENLLKFSNKSCFKITDAQFDILYFC